jgi:phosphatidylinositol-3-phosphatase
VVWIVMENKSYSQIIGSANAPYINALAHRCGLASGFAAESHPSLPNYIAMTTGSLHGITDDGDPSEHPLAVQSIFSQLGTGWRALAESMPSNCYRTNAGLYAVRHNPAVYFTNIRTRECMLQDMPLGRRPNLTGRFTFVTPNICHDMHSCPSTGDDEAAQTRAGDDWLATFVPKVLSSPQYRSGAMTVFVTWDEDSPDNHIATLVLSPYTRPGTTSPALFNHYSLLRTTEDMLGLRTHIANAAGAPSMRAAFHL